MSKGRERTIRRRKINGEFLDAMPWRTVAGNYINLSTRRGFRSIVEVIEPNGQTAVSFAELADTDAGRASDRTR